MFESIAKTDTTHTALRLNRLDEEFESIAKTDTTHTIGIVAIICIKFENIAKTDTTHTLALFNATLRCLLGVLNKMGSIHNKVLR